MKLQLYIYKCKNCGNTFKSPELIGDPYGEFLMRSESGEIGYLSTFDYKAFQEVKDFFEKSPLLKSYDKITRAKIFHDIFGVIGDLSKDQSKYQIGRNPSCPNCHANNDLSWHPSNPPEIVDIPIETVTHNRWNKLDASKKKEVLNNAIQAFLKIGTCN